MFTQSEMYMKRCLELAQMGEGKVAPNPLVGCVVVHNNRIIGEGWHQLYGGAHAEVNAIAQVVDQSLLAESTVYVNLEPCSHFGKTPPCADLLIQHKVKKVVVGMVDPFPEVAGTGITKLKAASIDVEVGVLESQCKDLNKRFITFVEQKRPYIILKWAQTSDGFLGPDAQTVSPEIYANQRHITGKTVQVLVHKWRGAEASIMVGTSTALLDNPRLDTRAFPGSNPIRVVVDKEASLPHTLHLFDGSQPTLVFTAQDKFFSPNAQTEYITLDFTQAVWPQIVAALYARKIQSIIVEGGLVTLNFILQSGLWDEAQVFTTPKILGKGVKAPEVSGELVESFTIDFASFQRIKNR
jgi:diaminohydroxyphosphoribosylaminopyrimidine deaminase / 5-amino-6-(5-phosphoribosylamino)uracil reductase